MSTDGYNPNSEPAVAVRRLGWSLEEDQQRRPIPHWESTLKDFVQDGDDWCLYNQENGDEWIMVDENAGRVTFDLQEMV